MENVTALSACESSWLRGKCIGKGSFGFVHLAVYNCNNQIFAVKSVDQNNCLPIQLGSIENEIHILRSLSSPYIVNCLGDDVTYEPTSHRNLHLEYMPNGSVADVADVFSGKGDGVDEIIVRSYTWCILSALRYLHAKSIAHCDVKGRNILVGHAPGTCKLADFGSAMEVSDHRGEKTPILQRGSPLWMAPEVVRREYQGPESDVWSLGCTVIEMISGKPAWKDEGVDTLCRIGFSDELPELPTQLSEPGRDFLSKCLRREQSERWSCDQLLQHPFVSQFSTNTVAEPSPRCVLDWISTEFSDEDDEENELSSNSSIQVRESSARGRISELASNTGAIWESDGWMVVRDGGCDGRGEERGNDEGEGTRWEYFKRLDSGREPHAIHALIERATQKKYARVMQKKLGRHPTGSYGGCGFTAGSSCRYGIHKMGLTVEWQKIIGFYSWCKLLLLLIIIFIFNWLYSLICSLRPKLCVTL